MKEQPPIEEKVHNVASRINKGLFQGNRFFPSGTTNLKKILDTGIHIVSSERYTQLMKDAAVTTTPEALDKALSTVPTTAAFIGEFMTGERTIYIAEEQVHDATRDDLTRIYLEELAHAYYAPNVPRPVAQIRDDSLNLFPFNSKHDLIMFLRDSRSIFAGQSGDVSLENLEYVKQGFTSAYFEGETRYPVLNAQIALEEARASILSGILFSKVRGTELLPYGSLKDQLSYGYNDLAASTINPTRRGELPVGLVFYGRYINPNRLKEDTIHLLQVLHTPDPDVLVKHLESKPDSLQDFIDITDRVWASL